MGISDDDAFNSDDDIDNVFIIASQEVSSEFSGVFQVISAGTRIIMQMRFRVTCTDGYVGPHCDCHSQNDDINGHYQCEDDGTITCLPGYEDPSTFCRQGKWSVCLVCYCLLLMLSTAYSLLVRLQVIQADPSPCVTLSSISLQRSMLVAPLPARMVAPACWLIPTSASVLLVSLDLTVV